MKGPVTLGYPRWRFEAWENGRAFELLTERETGVSAAEPATVSKPSHPVRKEDAASHHAGVIGSAREGYAIAGRGFVLSLDEKDEDRYVTLEELRENLAAEPEMLGMLAVAEPTHNTYDPKAEALVLIGRGNAIHVILVSRAGLRVLGQIDFIPTV